MVKKKEMKFKKQFYIHLSAVSLYQLNEIIYLTSIIQWFINTVMFVTRVGQRSVGSVHVKEVELKGIEN